MAFEPLLTGGVSYLFRNVDETVMKSTRYIALIVLIGSLLMQAVFLMIGLWDITVLWGNLLGAAAAIANFFIMALTVQRSLEMEPGEASKRMKSSHSLRMLMLLVVCVIGGAVPCFNIFAVLIPLVFPSIGAKLSGVLMKK